MHTHLEIDLCSYTHACAHFASLGRVHRRRLVFLREKALHQGIIRFMPEPNLTMEVWKLRCPCPTSLIARCYHESSTPKHMRETSSLKELPTSASEQRSRILPPFTSLLFVVFISTHLSHFVRIAKWSCHGHCQFATQRPTGASPPASSRPDLSILEVSRPQACERRASLQIMKAAVHRNGRSSF